MFRQHALIVSTVITLNACAEGQAQDVESENLASLFTGQWVNDRNSAVSFTVEEGLLSGFYQTALGQPDKSKNSRLRVLLRATKLLSP